MSLELQLEPGEYAPAIAARLAAWGEDDVLARVWAKDHTVWSAEPVAELTDRLGWLDLPDRLADLIPDLELFRDELVSAGISDVVVLGMGGSSLAPDVFTKTFGSAAGAPRLRVLDSTHPDAVLALGADLDMASTVFIVASKSGTTVEPLSFMEYFWDRVRAVTQQPGRHFVATTDPGSRLEEQAAERSFRQVFLAPPDVGGRYSAFTAFGMVPAAAIGADLPALQLAAAEQQRLNSAGEVVATAPACRMGAALGELAIAGRDKVTFITSDDLAALPAWIEQLIAESTGKSGRGIIPIGGEPLGPAGSYGADRFFVMMRTARSARIDTSPLAGHPVATITLDSTADISGVMYLMEMATALAGAAIGIQPFDQPDVQLSKELARDAIAGKLDLSQVDELDVDDGGLGETMRQWLESSSPGDYVGIHAFLAPTEEAASILQEARIAIRDATGLATTLDFGPRFLHSTGQLHKGGPNTGLFVEIVDHPARAVPVPTTDYDFAKLVTAQALGDHLALRRRDRRMLLVCLGEGGYDGLRRVASTLVESVGG